MQRIILLVLLIPFSVHAQTIKYRNYKPGETFKYKLTTESYRNGQFSGKALSVSSHRVIKEAGIFSEEIRWLSKTSFTPKDTAQLDAVAQKVIPYKVSLSPQGKVAMPRLTIPEMVGDITDLNTFYVAVAPALNMQRLSLKNKSFTSDKFRQGNFADSIVILYGTDCIQVTQKLVSQTKEYIVVETAFTPPPSFCLEPLLDTVAQRTPGLFNNIQMLQKSPDGKLNLFWGVEHFTITSRIDARSGKLLSATMDNRLNLRMRYNISQDLKAYAVEMFVTIERKVQLELVE